jgi:hypothetical protein
LAPRDDIGFGISNSAYNANSTPSQIAGNDIVNNLIGIGASGKTRVGNSQGATPRSLFGQAPRSQSLAARHERFLGVL